MNDASSVQVKVPVPFVDLRAQNDEVRSEVEAAFRTILDNSSFIGGPFVEDFERNFASFCGTSHAGALANGTDAVRIALQVCGVGAGDAVVTVAHTFIATAEAVVQLGAHPLFVDVEEVTKNMSPAALAAFMERECDRVGDRTVHRESGRRIAAILPVHLYGQSADMSPILETAAAYGVPVVEDACQAHGATYRFPDGREVPCGAMGRAAAFSFYPGKNLGAMGEGGALTTNEPELAQAARTLRDHGQRERYIHVTAQGTNARLDSLQAAILDIKLRRLPTWNDGRRAAAEQYAERFAGASFEIPTEMPYARHVYHLYVIHVDERETLRERLSAEGIGVGLHYPIPLHLQAAFSYLGLKPGSLPVTEASSARLLSLPMYPHLTERMVDVVADAVLRHTGG